MAFSPLLSFLSPGGWGLVSHANRTPCIEMKGPMHIHWVELAHKSSVALGKGLLLVHGLSHHQPSQWALTGKAHRVSRWDQPDCLKAGSNAFLIASLEVKFKILVCLPLQLKGMEKEDVTPRKR